MRHFVAVAEEGHMTRAAAKLGIQQPPLSQQVKALETMLGLPLLLRHPKGVSLTDGGRLFLAEARRLLEDVDAMRHRMALVARGVRGVLSVGFTSSAATHALTPRTLRACRTRSSGSRATTSWIARLPQSGRAQTTSPSGASSPPPPSRAISVLRSSSWPLPSKPCACRSSRSAESPYRTRRLW